MEEEIHWRVYVDLLSNTDLTTEVGFGVKAHLEHVHICTYVYDKNALCTYIYTCIHVYMQHFIHAK